MTKLFARWQLKRIQEVLKTRRVVVISGPRQGVKTTLAKPSCLWGKICMPCLLRRYGVEVSQKNIV